MANNNNKIDFSKVQSIFFFGLIALFTGAMIYLISPFVYPIFWAAVIAVVFYPIYSFINNHLRIESLSSFLVVIIVVAVVLLPLSVIALLVVNQALNIYNTLSVESINNFLDQIIVTLNDTPLAPYLEQAKQKWSQNAANIAQSIALTLVNRAQQITSSSMKFLVQVLVMLYTLYYFFKDGKKLLKRLMHLSPLGDKYEKNLYQKFTSTVSATLKSTLIIGAIQSILGGLLFIIAGIKGAILWGIIMFIFAVIPALGAPFIIVPAGLILLVSGSIGKGVLLLVGATIVGTIDNLIRPILVGKDIQMHPLWVFFATLGGIIIFGVSGFVIGPVIAALFLSIISIYDEYYKTKLEHN